MSEREHMVFLVTYFKNQSYILYHLFKNKIDKIVKRSKFELAMSDVYQWIDWKNTH